MFAKRVETFNACLGHVLEYSGALRAYLLDVDRARMTDSEREASIAREAAIEEVNASTYGSVGAVLDRSWNPEILPRPGNLDLVLGP